MSKSKRDSSLSAAENANTVEADSASSGAAGLAQTCYIKFKNGHFEELRRRLLDDLSKEHYAVMLGKQETIGTTSIVNVYDIRYLSSSDYNTQSAAFLSLRKEFLHSSVTEVANRLDDVVLLDVHTHPFSTSSACFSATDDADETSFCTFLHSHFTGINYASIVLSQSKYSARIWQVSHDVPTAIRAAIRTQTIGESIDESYACSARTDSRALSHSDTNSMFHRGVLALGLETMRQIVDDQAITVVGVGGIGSVIAEHLVHMGFHTINLIDNDTVEVSNLNRIVGAYYTDAMAGRHKVDVVKTHLERINPDAHIAAYKNDIYDAEIEEVAARSDWLLVGTDNHSSRFRCQQLAFKYFVPLITAGVNITVSDGRITDMSGEVITMRMGDNCCLHCLGRLNPIGIASERHSDEHIRSHLVERGYVTGADVKEPAVKTLNSIVATLLVDVLVNQYTGLQKHMPILVYENNKSKAIYEDLDSVKQKCDNCFICSV